MLFLCKIILFLLSQANVVTILLKYLCCALIDAVCTAEVVLLSYSLWWFEQNLLIKAMFVLLWVALYYYLCWCKNVAENCHIWMLRQVYGVELILRLKVYCHLRRVTLPTFFSTVVLRGEEHLHWYLCDILLALQREFYF